MALKGLKVLTVDCARVVFCEDGADLFAEQFPKGIPYTRDGIRRAFKKFMNAGITVNNKKIPKGNKGIKLQRTTRFRLVGHLFELIAECSRVFIDLDEIEDNAPIPFETDDKALKYIFQELHKLQPRKGFLTKREIASIEAAEKKAKLAAIKAEKDAIKNDPGIKAIKALKFKKTPVIKRSSLGAMCGGGVLTTDAAFGKKRSVVFNKESLLNAYMEGRKHFNVYSKAETNAANILGTILYRVIYALGGNPYAFANVIYTDLSAQKIIERAKRYGLGDYIK